MTYDDLRVIFESYKQSVMQELSDGGVGMSEDLVRIDRIEKFLNSLDREGYLV